MPTPDSGKAPKTPRHLFADAHERPVILGVNGVHLAIGFIEELASYGAGFLARAEVTGAETGRRVHMQAMLVKEER